MELILTKYKIYSNIKYIQIYTNIFKYIHISIYTNKTNLPQF